MAYCQNQTSLWGNNNDKYIKFGNSSIVAIEGANTVETQLLTSLRVRYSQIFRARITLKPGQADYLLNYGEEFNVIYSIDFGFVFKGIYK